MNNRSIWCKFFGPARNTVIKAGADRKEHITAADSHIRGVGAMNAKIAGIEPVRCWNCASSHNGGDGWNACYLGKPLHVFFCPADMNAASDQE